MPVDARLRRLVNATVLVQHPESVATHKAGAVRTHQTPETSVQSVDLVGRRDNVPLHEERFKKLRLPVVDDRVADHRDVVIAPIRGVVDVLSAKQGADFVVLFYAVE
jgi:hypothetical protein